MQKLRFLKKAEILLRWRERLTNLNSEVTLRNFTERSELTGIFKINQLLILINIPYTKSKCKFSPPNSHAAVEMFKQSRNSVI